MAPAAMRNWASTRSMPVTCSVTVCSTWMRGLHSMKKCSPRLGDDEELDGAGVDVARRASASATALGRGSARAAPASRPGAGRDLDDLLVAQLHRAVAVVEVDDVAVGVGEDLHLDVAGPVDEPLDEQRAVAERGRRLAAAALERLGHVAGAVHGAHAAPAAAGRRLEHHRVADLARRLRAASSAVATALGAARARPGCRATGPARGRATLSPNSASASGDGPTNVMPAAAQRRAKAAFSARKP